MYNPYILPYMEEAWGTAVTAVTTLLLHYSHCRLWYTHDEAHTQTHTRHTRMPAGSEHSPLLCLIAWRQQTDVVRLLD